jgi:SAM-dependent methyltransferase
MHRRFWYLAFPGIWYATYALKQRRKLQNWTDVQYYRAMFSMVSLRPQVEGDKFSPLREIVTGEIKQDRVTARILDLATGCGYQAGAAWRHGYRKVFACDLVQGRISLARDHNPDTGIHFLVSDMGRIGFPTGFFDAITISAGLHDLPAAAVQEVLRECGRVLRAGGQLLMLEPRCIRDWPAYFRPFYAFVADTLDESINMRDFIELDLVALAEKHGFTLRSKRTFWLGGVCLYACTKNG